MAMIYHPIELFDKLKGEHDKGYFYRGQEKEYPGPLWPSAYRRMFRTEDCLTIEDDSRLRGSGNRFHFRFNTWDWTLFKEEAESQIQRRYDEDAFRTFLRLQTNNALGYPLAQCFFQQMGLGSEGVDVTDNVEIAFFFALHEFGPGGYRLRSDMGSPGIIYRWRFDTPAWTLHSTNQYDFHSCPPIIPVRDVIHLFETCNTLEEYESSVENYRNAIRWNMLDFNLDEIRGRRPFHLIRFPRSLVGKARVVRQDASLLLPDVVSAEDFLNRHTVRSPEVLEELRHGLWVEDLAQGPTCERFYFNMDDTKKLSRRVGLAAQDVFPADDMLSLLLRGWMKAFIQNPYGTLPIFPSAPAMDYATFVSYMLDEHETDLFL